MEDPVPVDLQRWRRRLDQFDIPERHFPYLESVLITPEERQQRIDAVAADITTDYRNANITEVAMLYVLQGAMPFFTDLIYSQDFDLDPFWCYADSDRYDADTTSNKEAEIFLQKDTAELLEGQHVIVVEDLSDQGYTLLPVVRDYIEPCGPASIAVAALAEKQEREEVRPHVDGWYVGFSLPNTFIVGRGFDYNEQFRGLNYICILDEKAIEFES